MSTITYTVTGMTCGHCEAAVRSEVSEIDGVTVLDVSKDRETLVLEVSTEAEGLDAAVLAAVDEAGYSATRA